jgi:hypothetical protein
VAVDTQTATLDDIVASAQSFIDHPATIRILGRPLIEPPQFPEPGQLIHLRQHRWLVEAVDEAPHLGEATLVRAACVDDDAQGELVSVLWEHELDARVIEDSGWRRVGEQRFDDPELFAAYARTVRWGCVTATDPSLFQAPFRAGIRLDAYQLEPLRKARRRAIFRMRHL